VNNTQSLLPRLLPVAVSLGAAALLALAVFNTFNSYRATLEATQDGGVTLRNQAAPQTAVGMIDLAKIPNWHLFGKEDLSKPTPPPKAIIEAPTTPLELTLQGTFLGKSKTEESWAIISSSDKEQKMYKVGDEILGGATLFAVESFQVILERNGRHESLPLPRPSMSEELQTTAISTPISTPRPMPKSDSSNLLPKAGPPTANRHAEQQALMEEMARIRRKFAK